MFRSDAGYRRWFEGATNGVSSLAHAPSGSRRLTKEISVDTRFTGANECRGGCDPVGANGVSTEGGRARADQPRDAEQRVRFAAAPERDSIDLRPCYRLKQSRIGLGQCSGRACYLGAV